MVGDAGNKFQSKVFIPGITLALARNRVGTGPFRPHEVAVARVDDDGVRIDSRGLQQRAHKRGLVLAIAVVARQHLGSRRPAAGRQRD